MARRIARTTADSVISVLGGRGLTVTDDVKQRIKSSTDIEQLAEWLKRSLSVSGAEELFQEPV